MIRSYNDLIVWQKAMDLACEARILLGHLPRPELRIMGDQIQRAAISIPANIAEGHGQRSRREYARFVTIASGSVRELETFAILVKRQSLVPPEVAGRVLGLAGEVG